MMRVFLILAGTFIWMTAAHSGSLTVRVIDPPPSGTIALVLFDSPNAFGDLRDPARVERFQIDPDQVYRLDDVTPGEYALMVYFDENNNDRIDKSFIGIPKEPLGFSQGYEPKGPPNFSGAAFVIGADELKHFDVTLYRPLGELGRFGLGVGVIGRSSPYRDYDGGVYRVIPAITYRGKRLQIYGPNIQFGLLGAGKKRLALTGEYRIGVYEESESPFLRGMGDREDTFMAGLAVQIELPHGIQFSANAEYDILDNIGGYQASVFIDKSFQRGKLRLAPKLGINWLSSELSNHDFGVPANRATAFRPAYALDDTFSVEGGVGFFYEVTRDWLLVGNLGLEILDSDVTNSPIVEDDYVVKGFAAINYVF